MTDEEREEVETRQTPACPGGFLYEIRAGDTFYALARRYGTTVEAITAANPGVDPRRLQIGQLICIPVAVPTPPVPPVLCPGGTPYVIRQGDTLYRIAQRYGTTVDALLRANPGIDPMNLQIGQVICIPVPIPVPPPTVCPGGVFYTIRAGDTLYTIAAAYGTTVQAILAANPGLDPMRLQVGQVICVPLPAVAPRTCTLALAPSVTGPVTTAGGALWMRTDASGRTELLVIITNVPSPTSLGAATYTALFTWGGYSFQVPMTEALGTGIWAGTAVQQLPAAFFSTGSVNVWPGPVLGGLVANCK
ncbi:MAG: LysM peptidoglycan-binding domain-containing protein [Bacillota bacterium]|jgi:LysM repeat protein